MSKLFYMSTKSTNVKKILHDIFIYLHDNIIQKTYFTCQILILNERTNEIMQSQLLERKAVIRK